MTTAPRIRYELARSGEYSLAMVDGATPPHDQIVLQHRGRTIATLAERCDFSSYGVSTMAARVPYHGSTVILQGRTGVDQAVADRRLREAIERTGRVVEG